MKRITREWVRKAEADYKAAVRESRVAAHDLVCFLCQQCVEKYIKALLDENTLHVPRTHDLRHVARLAEPLCPRLKAHLDDFRALSAHAVVFRYPGHGLPPDRLGQRCASPARRECCCGAPSG